MMERGTNRGSHGSGAKGGEPKEPREPGAGCMIRYRVNQTPS
jgi:hypothetical protein